MRTLYLLFLLIIIPELTFASHATGAEISYSCLGNSQYYIVYTFYRDCSGIPAPSTVNIEFASQMVNLNPLPGMPLLLHTSCPNAQTTCSGGTFLGLQKWVYTGIVTLPAGSSIVSHTESARSSAMTTITGAGSDNLFVYALIVNVNGECNESPIFTAEPTFILCQGNSYCIPPFVTDPDGDSLSFELITPRTGPNLADTVSYLPGYSTQQPLTSSPPITINPVTGELCVSPAIAPEVTPIAMLVSEFRNGVLIGQVERDIQIRVESCSNNLPSITGFNGLPSNVMNVCANQQNCFFITAADLDSANNTFVVWDGNFSNSTTTHSFGSRDTLFVCWTPSDSDTIQQHCFSATVTDDNCPYPALISKSFCMNVIPSNVCNPVSVNEISENSFTIFPQPASGELNFQFKAIQQKQSLIIYPLSGKEVGRYQINDKRLKINSSGFSEGIYIATVTDEFGRVGFSKRLIILK